MPRDCFEGGGALAEVVTLYEKMNEEGKSNNEMQEEEEQSTNHWTAVEVVLRILLSSCTIYVATRHFI